MTTFIGPRPEYDDHSSGTIRIEIDFESWASSGRDKHTDPLEQGAWIAQAIAMHLRHAFDAEGAMPDDHAVHDLRYYGPVTPSTEEPVSTHDVGIRPTL